jgi:hypothetical protein
VAATAATAAANNKAALSLVMFAFHG